MAIPELDLKKVNLQTAVGYLISLHENEYQWNLLGIKVIGAAATANDIPAGTYEYGDAYMIGAEPPYDMYIYTRPDGTVHTEGYWFNVGKFPLPGPQGPKGDGLEQIDTLKDGSIKSLTQYGEKGFEINSEALVSYKDSTTGEDKTQHFKMISNMPIVSGKYISINPNDKKAEIKVDDTALALDYIKLDKTKRLAIPQNNAGVLNWLPTSINATAYSLVQRDNNGNANLNKVNLSQEGFTIGGNIFDQTVMVYGLKDELNITDQSGGTLTAHEAYVINQINICRPQIQGRTYNRVSKFGEKPVIFMSCDSTGTIYILTCDTTNKTYTISTLASQATEIYRHGISMNDSDIQVKLDIYNSNSQNYTYSDLKTKLSSTPAYCATARIRRSEGVYYYSPATISWNQSIGQFMLSYNNTDGNSLNINWTPSAVSDNGTSIATA